MREISISILYSYVKSIQIWTNVYPVSNPLGYNVVGGRVTGPGTGGFTLGGGFSWLTNQYDLFERSLDDLT